MKRSTSQIRQVDGHHGRNASLLHGDAVQFPRHFHRVLIVRNDDDLAAFGHFANQIVETVNVRIIEWRIDLIQETVRRRLHQEDGKNQGYGRERLLPP